MRVCITPPVRVVQLGKVPLVAVLLGFTLRALASLGGDITSVEVDRAHMNATVNVTTTDAYNIHQIQARDGVFVDEYVSPAGTVFAVTWHGQFPPDMQQILGTYFSQYTAALAAQEKHYGHRPLTIEQSGLVVQTGGHMRDYFGRAYVSGLLPHGVNPNQIQ
jgi:hypothetical protein